MNRPNNITKMPVSKLPAPNHRQRTETYAVGDDPDISPAKYELFYEAFCISGGSAADAYSMTMSAWDEKVDGPAPTQMQVIGYARSQDWRNRFLQQMLDPGTGRSWSELAEAKLRGGEMLAVDTVLEIARGEGDPKAAGSRLKAAQTLLFLRRLKDRPETRRDQLGMLEQAARELNSGEADHDLSEEEITQRIAEDWERSRKNPPASQAGSSAKPGAAGL